MDVNGDERLHPLRCGFPLCDTVGGLNAAFADPGGALHRERSGRRPVHRRGAARLHPAADGLGGRQPAHRRPGPGAHGQRQLHGGPRAPSGPGRARQHRRQQAGAVGGARPRCWASGAASGDPRFQRARRAQEEPRALTPLLEARLRERRTPRPGWSALNARDVPSGAILALADALRPAAGPAPRDDPRRLDGRRRSAS